MSAAALTLERARAGGAVATRERLAAALGWWRADPAAQDEWLVVPKLQMAFRTGRSQAPDAFAREFGRALAKERGRARLDPPPGEVATGPIKFSRASRWYSWLAGTAASAQSGTTVQHKVEAAQHLRKAVLREPLLLLAVARQLAQAGLLVPWCAQLASADCELALMTLREAAGALPPPVSSNAAGMARAGTRSRATAEPIAVARARDLLAEIEAAPGLPPRPTAQGLTARSLLAVLAEPPLAATALALLRAEDSGLALQRAEDRGQGKSGNAAFAAAGQADCSLPAAKRLDAPSRTAARSPRPADVPTAAEQFALHVLKRPAILPKSAEHQQIQPTPQPLRPSLPATPAPRPLIACDLSFQTAFAGVLFLTNSFIALDLYPDFTRPRGERLAPSPSWLLAQVARCLFGHAFERDPLGCWLKDNAQPGPLPDAWQVTDDWEPSRGSSWRYKSGGCAVDWDQRGFFAGIGTLGPRSAYRQQAPRRIARLLPRRVAPNAFWLSGFVQYLRYRLNQAEVSVGGLRLPGTVALIDGDLTARIALADLPLAVRMAGLDRDPGWLPAEGRALRFEFV